MTTPTFTAFDYSTGAVSALISAISAKEATLFSGWSHPQPLSDAQVAFIKQRVETLLDLTAKGVWTGNPLNYVSSGANWSDIDSTTYPAGVNPIIYVNPVAMSGSAVLAFAANLLNLGDYQSAEFNAVYSYLAIRDASNKLVGYAVVRARQLGEMPINWYLASDGATAMVSIFEWRFNITA